MCDNNEKKKKNYYSTYALCTLGILFSLLGYIVGFFLHVLTDKTKNYYSDITKVVTVDKKNDTVVIENYAGFRYAFMGAEDWQIDDYASVIMDSNGTENIYDDKIVSVRYEKIF